MSEQASANPNETLKMAPALAIGGVLTAKKHWPLYAPVLKDPGCELGIRERFSHIPDGGKGTIEEIYGQLEEELIVGYERLGARVALVGHSLGGLVATMLALEHPDKIASVIAVAGAQEGIKRETPSSKALRILLRGAAGQEDIKHDSEFMTKHKAQVAADWSPDTSLHLVGTVFDDLLLAPQGLGLELPAGQQAEKRIITGPLPGAGRLIRLIPGMPEEVQVLKSRRPVGHIDAIMSGAVVDYARQARRDAAGAEPIDLTPVNSAPAPTARVPAVAVA